MTGGCVPFGLGSGHPELCGENRLREFRRLTASHTADSPAYFRPYRASLADFRAVSGQTCPARRKTPVGDSLTTGVLMK